MEEGTVANRQLPAVEKVEIEKVLIGPKKAAELLDIDIITFGRHIEPYMMNGDIESLVIGARRKIVLTSLLDWVAKKAQSSRVKVAS